MANNNTTADKKGMATAVKGAFPLMNFEQIPNTVSVLPAIAQIILAAYLAYRCFPIISTRDISFLIIFPAYLILANHLRFANNLPIRQRPNDHPNNASVVVSKLFSGQDSPWFQRYVAFAGILGLLLPLITIFCAPEEVGNLAIPHLYLIWLQIVGESIVAYNTYVHRFISLLVPIGFSFYRMDHLVQWFLGSLSLFRAAASAPITIESISTVDPAITLGLVLSGFNLVFWTYNLFVTILLKITPEILADEQCESPDVRVMAIPFIGEPKKEHKE